LRTFSDRPFDWIAALALASGAIVIAASLTALAAALVNVATLLLGWR